jgi:hypothetical protein
MKKLVSLVAVLIVAIAGVSAFAHGNSNRDGGARIRVIHLSPDAPDVDVRVDGNVAISKLAFGQNSGYTRLDAGVYDVQVSPAGSLTPVVIDLTGPNAANLQYYKDYTALAVNTLASGIQPLLLVDDNSPVLGFFSRVRFVHASPDAPAVDIAVSNGPILWKNVSFKGVGDYIEIPRGQYDLEVRLAGTTTVALRVPAVQFEAARVYTIFAEGFAGGPSPALSVLKTEDSRWGSRDRDRR